MGLSVPRSISRWVSQAEVSAQIDHLLSDGREALDLVHDQAVGKTCEQHVHFGELVWVAEFAERYPTKIRVHAADRFAFVISGGHRRYLDVWVLHEQTQQLSSHIARPADDSNLNLMRGHGDRSPQHSRGSSREC